MEIKKCLASRKVKATLIGIISSVGVQYLGLPQDVAILLAQFILALVMIYVGGQSAVDVAKEKAKGEATKK